VIATVIVVVALATITDQIEPRSLKPPFAPVVKVSSAHVAPSPVTPTVGVKPLPAATTCSETRFPIVALPGSVTVNEVAVPFSELFAF
jgi:hypothetical protein